MKNKTQVELLNENITGQVHYVGDGCNPPHLPLSDDTQQHTAEEVIQLFQDYADKNEDENVRRAVEFISKELKK